MTRIAPPAGLTPAPPLHGLERFRESLRNSLLEHSAVELISAAVDTDSVEQYCPSGKIILRRVPASVRLEIVVESKIPLTAMEQSWVAEVVPGRDAELFCHDGAPGMHAILVDLLNADDLESLTHMAVRGEQWTDCAGWSGTVRSDRWTRSYKLSWRVFLRNDGPWLRLFLDVEAG